MRDLNLIPKVYLQQKKTKTKKKTMVLAIATIIAMFAGVTIGIFVYRFSMQNETARIEEELKEKTKFKSVESQMLYVKDQLEIRQKEAQRMSSQMINIAPVVDILEQITSESVYFETVSITDTSDNMISIQLIGKSQTQEDIVALIDNLRIKPNLKNIELSVMLKLNKENPRVKFTRNIKNNIFEPINDPGYSFTIRLAAGGDSS